MTNSIITGTGSYIPTVKVPNKQFLGNDFYDADGIKIAKGNVYIVVFASVGAGMNINSMVYKMH